jgi:peptidyl-prolyl cis-trans isomerase D
MLDYLRKRKRSWIIVLFLGIIVVTFIAFYGGSKYQSQGAADVAKINGESITQREFAINYEKELERYRELLKGSLTPEMIKGLNLKGTLLEKLVEKKLILQEAHSLGLTVTDEELATHLSQVPEFQVAGRFNKERYLSLLRANRLTPADFEEEQREQLTIQRLYNLILDSVQVTDAQVRDRYRFEQERIDLQFVRFPVSQYLSEVKITEEDIKKYYDRNKDSLKEPLKVQVEYLSYPFDHYLSSVQVSDKEIEDYYQANREAKFHTPKEAKVGYILIRLAPEADAKQKEDARARANRVVAEARGGKDFAQLAKQYSDDPTSAKGGDVGWVVQGRMPPELDKVIFSLSKGQVGDAIETPAGFQIIKIDDTKAEKTLTLPEATPEITRLLKLEKGKQEAAKIADRDREKALSGAELSKLAQDSGAAINLTKLFSNGEVLPEIGPNQEFYKSAFALASNDVSPIIEGNGTYYILKLKQKKEPAVPPLENVRADIEKGLKESKAYEIAQQKAHGLLDQLKKEKDLDKVSAQDGLKVEETGWFLRNAPQIPKIGELAETKGTGIMLSAQKPIPDKIYTQKDAAFVIAFKGSEGADMERFEKEKDALTKQALTESRQRVIQKFMEGLKAKAKIEIQTSTLEEG